MMERFNDKYIPEPNSGCWLWTANTNQDGYGFFWLNGRNESAHRVSWLLHRGPIPDGLCALRRCDNPCCVKPGHLFLGTTSDNATDRES